MSNIEKYAALHQGLSDAVREGEDPDKVAGGYATIFEAAIMARTPDDPEGIEYHLFTSAAIGMIEADPSIYPSAKQQIIGYYAVLANDYGSVGPSYYER